MSNIKQLPEDLIKKIAAGEVIERPASVVKELVENSIDAGANKIEVEVDRGGKYIKVSDNGAGISTSDIPLLFTRHATSKITSFNDLYSVRSLGFRGEALASISAVSKVRCKSKHRADDHGFEIVLNEGKLEKKTSGISIGTIFEIEDLFYNVPAREKFLKSDETEVNHIYEVVLNASLSHPEIVFRLINKKSVLLETLGSGDLKKVAVEVLGSNLEKRLIEIKSKGKHFELNGFISNLEIYKTNKKDIFIFINSRPVRCQIISKAIMSAYEGMLIPGKFPVVLLNFSFEPKYVDVNVHPTKREVKYINSTEVYNHVMKTIQDTLADYYKKKYEEKSSYSLPELVKSNQELSIMDDEMQHMTGCIPETKENFILHSEIPCTESYVSPPISHLSSQCLFSVKDLKCNIVYSKKTISNFTHAGNKVFFEVGSIFDEDLQVVFSGEFYGASELQKEFFNNLAELSESIYKHYISCEKSIQRKLLNEDFNEENFTEQNDKSSISRKKPQDSILYEVWERDFWTCVYCGKHLIDPKVAKEALSKAKDAFVRYLNKEGNEVTVHLLKEHSASYDHYFPASKFPEFNIEACNLFASCFECNRKKSNSLEIKTWKPFRQNAWSTPLEIAGLRFDSPRSFNERAKK